MAHRLKSSSNLYESELSKKLDIHMASILTDFWEYEILVLKPFGDILEYILLFFLA